MKIALYGGGGSRWYIYQLEGARQGFPTFSVTAVPNRAESFTEEEAEKLVRILHLSGMRVEALEETR